MKVSPRRIRRGFTLIELSVALIMGVMISAMIMALFNQQLAFLNIYRTQNFLTEEAPMISNYVSKIVGRAERFRLHDSLDDALTGTNPRLTPSPVVVLNFRQPDGSMRASILAFEDRGTGPALYYYIVPDTGTLGDPQWHLTNKPSNVQFSMEQGILRMILTGPEGESITFSGSMQQ